VKIETYIDSLVSYAMNTGLAEPCDHQVLTNRLLRILHKDDYEPSGEPQCEDLEEILAGFLDYACANGLCDDNITARDLFDTMIMGELTPMPREVIRIFNEKFWVDPKEATDWYYKFSGDTDYIRRYRIKKDMRWKYDSDYGELDITINLSKPEKDPKAIAAAKIAPQSSYPKCQLCVENEGYAGRINHPARENHRIVPIEIAKSDWCLQYSPYVIDFEIPKKYGLRQTIADTLGIGGIMRALRTIPVMEDFTRDMAQVCPNALMLNYTNPMAILTGYMLRYTPVKTLGLCHSVQVCSEELLKQLGMEDKLEGRRELIAGINHMAWLLEIKDRNGVDLYPDIKSRIGAKLADPEFANKVRLDYIRHFGYYCTESSEHNAEYNPFYIKRNYPELIQYYNIPLDEYPRRCVSQIEGWKKEYVELKENGVKEHNRSHEYASWIMESIVTNTPYQIGGNVLNTGHLITNLPEDACVEVPCLINGMGVNPCYVGALPVQCAAMNMTNINVQLLTIEAARTHKLDHVYQAAMLDPHTAAELDIDTIKRMVDDLIAAHGDYLPKFC